MAQLKDFRPADSSLSRRLNELISLNELLATLNTARTLEQTLDVILLTIMGQHPCVKAAVFLKETNSWRLGMGKGLRDHTFHLENLPTDDRLDGMPALIRPGHGDWDELSPLCEDGLFDLVIPAKNEGKLVGVICLGKCLLGDISEDKELLLALIADFGGVIMGNHLYRVDLEKMNRQLQRRLFQLNTLFEITGAFARCYEPEDVYQILANNLMGHFFISRCGVVTMEDRPQISFQKGLKIKAEPVLDGWPPLTEWPASVTSVDALGFEAPIAFMKEQKLRYAVPIASEGDVFALLLLGPRLDRRKLGEHDREFMVSLARQAAVALENVRLQAEVLEKKRMERELQLAREIQQRLLPKVVPSLCGYQIAAEMRPFNQVGGDFYDFIVHANGRLSLCLADVSGKSLPASMIMSTAQASLRALNSFPGISPREVIEKLNLHLFQSTQSNKFVTMFYAELDPETHRLQYINAGHNRPILVCPEKTTSLLSLGGMMVGMFPNVQYQVGTIDFEEGSELLIYTDGLSEVTDTEGEEFGDDRLIDLLKSVQGHGTVSEEMSEIVTSVMNFSDGQMVDDLTLLLIRRSSQES
ncbi:GAF domain-containing SpoIIE family protein phosphatase [Sulfidibacter corallicola]|uniref:SpoIIE family protein phosphatase n=1 Tax=Sulfidibacter corallicola TaxID=2818388 RepID=A0A8A4TTJ2_SULCO|nr:PP2C family protein-serine/threonine phosphatase [Sulfidibacter corallicola]QTD53286.1 SpoIIE family protein phosphatase [Sulfidibacter corallicola]